MGPREFTPEEKRRLMAKSKALAPICEQYLDFTTLGTAKDRKEVLEAFTEQFREHPGQNRTTTPRTYARRIVDTFDDVDINVISTSLRREYINMDTLRKIRAQEYTGIHARHYVLLLNAIRDLEARSGSSRQFHGLHDVVSDGAGRWIRVLDLSTDELYRQNVALLRYGVAISSALSIPDGSAMFLGRNSEDMIVDPAMQALIRSIPEQVDRIAQIVIERKAQDVDLIQEILGNTNTAVSDGML